MGGQLTKEEDGISSDSSIAVRKPFDLSKELEGKGKIVKVDEKGDRAGQDEEDEDERDFDPNNYDPKTVGPILPNGEINWECPCLGGAAHGPCGTEFRQAFSCFHYSKDDPKGSDCFPQFREMHVCFSKYPQLFPSKDDDEEEEDEGEAEEQEDGEAVKFDEDELKILNEVDNEGENKDPPKEDKEKQPKKDPQPDSKPSAENKSPPKKDSPRREARIPNGGILNPPQPAVV